MTLLSIPFLCPPSIPVFFFSFWAARRHQNKKRGPAECAPPLFACLLFFFSLPLTGPSLALLFSFKRVGFATTFFQGPFLSPCGHQGAEHGPFNLAPDWALASDAADGAARATRHQKMHGALRLIGDVTQTRGHKRKNPAMSRRSGADPQVLSIWRQIAIDSMAQSKRGLAGACPVAVKQLT
nr:hypothetical protein [Pandoravirus massiliensis]